MDTRHDTEVAERTRDAARHPAREARREAETGSGWYAWLARAGLLAKGASFAIVGGLAIALAFGEGGKATSRQGALATIAQSGWGKVVLVALAIGFAGYAIWRFIQALAEREDSGDEKELAKTWGKRAGYVGRGIIYAGLTYTTVQILMGLFDAAQAHMRFGGASVPAPAGDAAEGEGRSAR